MCNVICSYFKFQNSKFKSDLIYLLFIYSLNYSKCSMKKDCIYCYF